MKFFLDTAQVDEVKHGLEWWDIDGVTTNPRHVQVSGKPFLSVIKELAALVEGTEKTISVEVNPHLTDFNGMVKAASELADISPNFVIKLHCIEPTFKAIPVLAKRGVRVNVTLIFSALQALQAMRAGAYYVSPFIGWKETNGEEINRMIEDIVAIRDNYAFDTQVLVAAVRNARQIIDAAVTGADIVTAGFQVFKEGFEHPYTPVGMGKFQSFWDQTPYD